MAKEIKYGAGRCIREHGCTAGKRSCNKDQ